MFLEFEIFRTTVNAQNFGHFAKITHRIIMSIYFPYKGSKDIISLLLKLKVWYFNNDLKANVKTYFSDSEHYGNKFLSPINNGWKTGKMINASGVH